VGRPKKTSKAVEWKTLATLTQMYDEAGKPNPGPAIRTTYSNIGDRTVYSHTPGIVMDDGSFRPVQHLHDRHGEVYMLLLMDALAGVYAAKKTGIEVIEASYGLFEKSLRRSQETDSMLKKVDRAAKSIIEEGRSTCHARPRKRVSEQSGLKASLGDMLKAKGQGA